MYYHNGKGYNVGDVITTIDGVFGRVEVAWKTPTDQFHQLFSALSDAETPRCEAYTLDEDGKPLTMESGETVYDAVKSLYVRLAEGEAWRAMPRDAHAVNGRYTDLVIRNRVIMLFELQGDPRLMARTVDNKTLTTEIAQGETLTLARVKDLAQRASGLLGDTVTRMRIMHRVEAAERETFDDYDRLWGEGGQWPITVIVDKSYHYNATRNALLIYDGDEPVYCNNDGVECDDAVAIADTLDQGWEVY